MVQDVKKAYVDAPATQIIDVKIFDEDRGPGEERMCGLLKKSFLRHPRCCAQLGNGLHRGA